MILVSLGEKNAARVLCCLCVLLVCVSSQLRGAVLFHGCELHSKSVDQCVHAWVIQGSQHYHSHH